MGKKNSYQNVKVSVILCPDQSSEKFFCRGRQVIFIADVNAGFSEHGNAFTELQAKWRVQKLEGLGRELLADGVDLVAVPKGVEIFKSISFFIMSLYMYCFFQQQLLFVYSY